MRIAQVSPLYESVPPLRYGGTERVVSWMTEELMRQGHDVTLFASGDSVTAARLVSACDRSLRLDDRCVDPVAHHILQLEQVAQRASDFDVIHFHTEYLHFPLSRRLATPGVTTLHGRLDLSDLLGTFKEFEEMPVVSVSDAQREPLPWLNWQATVPHGMPSDRFRFSPAPGTYLAFLGRISAEKQPDRAIRIARAAGIPLRMAAKVDGQDREFFDAVVRPMLAGGGVEFLGEISEEEKETLLSEAMGLLFPIEWPEPFGIVMIESMACGTPVLGFRRGSVPEVVEHGVAGFVVDDIPAAVRAAQALGDLDRSAVRQWFEQRFTVERMVHDNLAVYEQVIQDTVVGHPAA